MTTIRTLLLALALLPSAALAEPVFPPGSRIGIEPISGMTVSKRFTGFEKPSSNAAITLIEMPPQAFADVSKGMNEDSLRRQGLTVKNREEIKVAGADAVLITGDQLVGGATLQKWLLIVGEPSLTALVIAQATGGDGAEAGMRAALTSLVIRPPLPLEDQITALPFRIGERAGLRPVRAMAGNSLLLTDGPNDLVQNAEQPIVILAQSVGPTPGADQREAFSRAALASSPTLKDIVPERSQGFRQRGADWHEIVARATDASSGEKVIVTQTIRFAPGGYLRMIGVARERERETFLPRFRKVADSVEPN